MPKVTYTLADGTVKEVEGEGGKTILQIAIDNDIAIEHACGGMGFCTTCLCTVKDGQAAIDEGRISPMNDKEENMGVGGPDERLGCQAQVLGDVKVELE